ncbi:MAG TPA: hypothetical protein VHX59_04660, partial [Mycobacteriales bacterium]|nr:hypothetical protein [Mycobacteriales bacterium]
MTLTDGARGRTASFREQVAGRARGASDPMLALAIFVPLLILYIATANVVGDSLSPDPVSAAVASWHWTIHHNFHLEDQIRPGLWLYVAKGHIVTNRTPGVVLFGIPFYELLGRGPILSMFPAAVAGATSAAGAVTLLVLALRRLLGNRIALVTGLILAFGTSTWSISADSLWTHGPNELLLAAAMYAFSRNRQLAAALFLGLACTVRPHLAFVPLVAGVWYAVRRRSVVPLAVFGAPAVVGVG